MTYRVEVQLDVEAESVHEAAEKVQTFLEKSQAAKKRGIVYTGLIASELPAATELVPIDEPLVPAEAHSDDFKVECAFDAAPWLAGAEVPEILNLAECDWGGDYGADRVAYDSAESHPDLAALFDYLDSESARKQAIGFECHVEPEVALAWLAAHRPEAIKALEAAGLYGGEE